MRFGAVILGVWLSGCNVSRDYFPLPEEPLVEFISPSDGDVVFTTGSLRVMAEEPNGFVVIVTVSSSTDGLLAEYEHAGLGETESLQVSLTEGVHTLEAVVVVKDNDTLAGRDTIVVTVEASGS